MFLLEKVSFIYGITLYNCRGEEKKYFEIQGLGWGFVIINSEQHANCSSRETILRSIQVKEILLYHNTSVLFLYILKISANY